MKNQKNIQTQSNLYFINLVNNKKVTKTEIAGRYKIDTGIEKKILKNIIKNLKLQGGGKDNLSLLDVGCGCGILTEYLIKYCNSTKIYLTLLDIKDVIKILQKNYKNFESNIKLINAEFHKHNFKKKKFDRILLYSVIQYTDNPLFFLKKAFKLLKKQGLIFIGDIPNINKKFRFLNSQFGKKFEIQYQKKLKKINKVSVLKKEEIRKKYNITTFRKFYNNTKQNKNINDKFILDVIKYFRNKNAHVYVFAQQKIFPFSFTREDILIEKI